MTPTRVPRYPRVVLNLVCIIALIDFASSSLPTKVHLKKNPGSKNSTVIGRDRNSLSITIELFLMAVFFRGALLHANSRYRPPPYSFYGGGYRSRHFWGLAGVRFLFYLNLYGNICMFTFKKKHTLEHSLPDLIPDLES